MKAQRLNGGLFNEIYSVCYRHKPSIYGYTWKKVKKDDIVQTLEKSKD